MNKLSMSEEEMIKRKYTRPYEKQIAELEKKNKVLAQNLEDTEIVNKALEKENAELKKQVEKHKWNDIFLEDCADYDKKIAEEYTTLQERIAELEQDNEAYEKENARLVQQYNDLQKENAELKERVSEQSERIRELTQELDDKINRFG